MGSVKGRSCQDHISSLYFIIENGLLKKQDTYTSTVVKVSIHYKTTRQVQ